MDEREITNTAREAEANPLLMLAALMGDPSAGIEAQEARGQRELVASHRVPTEMRGVTAEQMAALGFVLGDPEPTDPIFRPATLPEGWSKRGTGHSMWSEILDAKGRRRFAVFYKAAFYDRSAFLDASDRYGIETDFEGTPEEPGLRRIYLTDGGARGDLLASYREDDRVGYRDAYERAYAALDDRYPDWRKPLAYWD